MSKEIKLRSGAVLKITLAPFAEAKELYQVVLEEMKVVKMDDAAQVEALLKDAFCIGFSSKKIDKALNACMKRVTYQDLKIDENTFEPEDARQDYLPVCYEVAKVNIGPFLRSLYAEWSEGLEALNVAIQKLSSPMKPEKETATSSSTSDSVTPGMRRRSPKHRVSTPAP